VDVAELSRQGVAVIVGTCDASLVPAVSRGWGPVLSDDGTRLTLCVDAPAGSATRANLEAGSPLAVTMSRPTSYLSVQLKGPVFALGEPDAEALRMVEEHLESVTAETTAIGVPPTFMRTLAATELLAVGIEVTERYDQTPGPGAGRAL
jgi:hypothetical protein